MVKSIFSKIDFTIDFSRSHKISVQFASTYLFFEKQLCIFFTSADSSHYLLHKSIKIQLPNE